MKKATLELNNQVSAAVHGFTVQFEENQIHLGGTMDLWSDVLKEKPSRIVSDLRYLGSFISYNCKCHKEIRVRH